ncbi:PPC domain-containing protein [Luteimonas sp. R10]|uniref:PPC domain-containing protein n=1 Tax=Luteimonas sp. R10 TaxID=3108176 RepID=UPI00308DCF14|nr:PPC domain-containing protein [Luteimonas sp. R10]
MRIPLLPLALLTALAATPAVAADKLTPGQTVEGALQAGDRSSDSGGRSRDYALDLDAGQLVAINAKSEDFDTVLILFGPDGDRISENDDQEGGGTDSLLVVSAPVTGTYTVRLNSLPMGEGHTGRYSLRALAVGDD